MHAATSDLRTYTCDRFFHDVVATIELKQRNSGTVTPRESTMRVAHLAGFTGFAGDQSGAVRPVLDRETTLL
jgi:hypothetical protein